MLSEKLNETFIVQTRPCSPRKFFERIYGNLDNKTQKTTAKIEETTKEEIKVSNSNPSSPTTSYSSTSDCESKSQIYSPQQPHQAVFPVHLQNLRGILPLAASDGIFPPGLAAFRKLHNFLRSNLSTIILALI